MPRRVWQVDRLRSPYQGLALQRSIGSAAGFRNLGRIPFRPFVRRSFGNLALGRRPSNSPRLVSIALSPSSRTNCGVRERLVANVERMHLLRTEKRDPRGFCPRQNRQRGTTDLAGPGPNRERFRVSVGGTSIDRLREKRVQVIGLRPADEEVNPRRSRTTRSDRRDRHRHSTRERSGKERLSPLSLSLSIAPSLFLRSARKSARRPIAYRDDSRTRAIGPIETPLPLRSNERRSENVSRKRYVHLLLAEKREPRPFCDRDRAQPVSTRRPTGPGANRERSA